MEKCLFLVGEDCNTGTANSQGNLQQKDLSHGSTKGTPDLISVVV